MVELDMSGDIGSDGNFEIRPQNSRGLIMFGLWFLTHYLGGYQVDIDKSAEQD
jgi:hypothetical protein